MNLIRWVLLIAMPIVAIGGMCWSSSRLSVVPTGDPYDLAIVGNGYLWVTDRDDQHAYFTRAIRLAIDANGNLCALIRGKAQRIDPPLTIPWGHEGLIIHPDGRVEATEAIGSTTQIGSIQVATFSDRNLADHPVREFSIAVANGPPVPCIPGQDGSGVLLQGYREQWTLPISFELICVSLMAYVIVVLTNQAYVVNRKPR